MFVLRALCLLLISISVTESAKILGIIYTYSYSHYQLGESLLKELARRGHQVTFITPTEEEYEVENLTRIEISDAYNNLDVDLNMFKYAGHGLLTRISKYEYVALPFLERVLNHIKVQNLIKSQEKFDIIIFDRLYNEAFHGFCAHFGAHCIVSTSVPASLLPNNQMGNSGSPSYVPIYDARITNKMNCFERFYNTLGYCLTVIWFHLHTLPLQNDLMHRYFPNAPHLSDIYYNVSLMLINSHVAVTPVIPLLPNMIEVGGYHVKPAKTLPKDLKEHLDNSNDGAILFSMGTNLDAQNFNPLTRRAILKVFERLNQTVLFKWDNESIPDKPKNVKIYRWLPQNDVLAHPNVKLFISHGGIMSVYEAVYHGVPILGVPVFGDQYYNMITAEEDGNGISVRYSDLNVETFGKAVDKLLNDPNYLKSAKAKSKILQDNPIKQLDKAVFWIEYVLRHNGAGHLKTAALNLSWWQYLLLDVVTFTICVCIVSMIMFCYLFKRVNNRKVGHYKKNQ